MNPDSHDDPLMPPPPRAAYFDSALGAWILSRYADVAAALRDSRLRPVGASAGSRPADEKDPQTWVRGHVQAALSAAQLAAWQTEMERLAQSAVEALPADRPVDVVGEFARPWCAALAAMVTGADPQDAQRLIALARQVSAAAADPYDSALKPAAAAADQELERSLRGSSLPMAGPAFVALSQTLACFLARAWLALLRNPGEWSRLRDDPDLMPAAIEELLRFAGPADRLFRLATATTVLPGATIADGQRAVLMVSSANRDPAQFPEPDRLDITRRAAGQVAFGAGAHSCVGAPLIRMAAGIATARFSRKFRAVEVREPVEWWGGAVFRAPVALYVLLRAERREGDY